jgi:hypothetical protein
VYVREIGGTQHVFLHNRASVWRLHFTAAIQSQYRTVINYNKRSTNLDPAAPMRLFSQPHVGNTREGDAMPGGGSNVLPQRSPTASDAEHWDVLFDAVTRRLRAAADVPLNTKDAAQLLDIVSKARAVILECVEALEQLRATRPHQLGRLGTASDAPHDTVKG